MVHGGFCHDRLRYIGSNLRIRAGHGGRQRILLPADGTGLCGRTTDYCLRPDPSLLPDESDVHLRLLARAVRILVLQDGGMVFLHLQDARCGCPAFSRMPDAPTDRIRTVRMAFYGQCVPDDALRLAIYVQGRSKIADLDRFVQDPLPHCLGRTLHRLYFCRLGRQMGRGDRPYRRERLLPYVFLR